MKATRTLAILNAVFFLVHLVPSQLTQLKLFNNQTIGDVSDKYPTLFTPAGITFAIWGLIYLSLAAFCVYHLLKAFRADVSHEANVATRRIGYYFMLNNLATGAWTIAWVQEWLVWSVLLMLVQLISLIVIHLKLRIFNPARTISSRLFTQFPLSIYLGWICIATVANISATLVGLQWTGWGFSEGFWAMLMLLVATSLTAFLVLQRRNPYIGFVTIWAFYGILLKHQELNHPSSPTIITFAWVGIGIIAVLVLVQLYWNLVVPRQHPATTRQG